MTTNSHRFINAPVHPYSALALVAADWLAMGLNILTLMDAYWPISLGAAMAAAISTFFVERRLDHASPRLAAIKAACVLPVILAPLPLLGTVVGAVMLAWALVVRLVPRNRSAA